MSGGQISRPLNSQRREQTARRGHQETLPVTHLLLNKPAMRVNYKSRERGAEQPALPFLKRISSRRRCDRVQTWIVAIELMPSIQDLPKRVIRKMHYCVLQTPLNIFAFR